MPEPIIRYQAMEGDFVLKIYGTMKTQLYRNTEVGISTIAAIRSIFYDFHALMNSEISYEFQSSFVSGKFDQLNESDFKEIAV